MLSHEVAEYAPLFGEIADAYFERELYAEAGHIYEILGGDPGVCESSSFAQQTLILLLTHRQVVYTFSFKRLPVDVWWVILRKLLKFMNMVSSTVAEKTSQRVDDWIVVMADPTHNEAKMKLAEIYEILNEPRKALDLVLQGEFALSFPVKIYPECPNTSVTVIASRRRRHRQDTSDDMSEEPATTTLFEEKARPKGKDSSAKPPNRLTVTQLRDLEAQKEREVIQGFHRIRQLWPRILAGGDADAEREWLVEAEKLVESFRETRNLFLTTRVSLNFWLVPLDVLYVFA